MSQTEPAASSAVAAPPLAETREHDKGRTAHEPEAHEPAPLENMDELIAVLETEQAASGQNAARQGQEDEAARQRGHTPQSANAGEDAWHAEDSEAGSENAPPHKATDAHTQNPDAAIPNAATPGAAGEETAYRELLDSLPPQARKLLTDREALHARIVREYNEQSKRVWDSLASSQNWINNCLAPVAQGAALAFEADFAGLDWPALQKSDPVTYAQLNAMYLERLNAVQQIMNHTQNLQKDLNQQRQVAFARHLGNELERAKPVLKALSDDRFGTPAFKYELLNYLTASGVPREHLDGMDSSYQLIMAVKAMLYDKAEQARAEAAKKVAKAPKVQGTKARSGGHDAAEARLRGLSAALDRDPNNRDILVDLLVAQRRQRN